MTFRKLALGSATIFALSAVALAHSGATGVIKERMDAMKSMGEAIKRIKPMMTGAAAYDDTVVREAAQVIVAQAGAAMIDRFPEGSNEHPSETLPRTWKEWERFTLLAARLETAAEGLVLAAGNGLHADSGMPDGQSHMMGGDMMGDQSAMMGGGGARPRPMSAEHIGQMSADGAFIMVTQVCSACHDRYRQDDG